MTCKVRHLLTAVRYMVQGGHFFATRNFLWLFPVGGIGHFGTLPCGLSVAANGGVWTL